MSVVLVTGAGGLIGSATVRHFAGLGLEVVGLDNDLRGQLFGVDGSVRPTINDLRAVAGYTHREVDVRDRHSIDRLVERYGRGVTLVVHCAAQPAHESPAPLLDWDVNAGGTVNVLDAVRAHAPAAVVVALSTIKVYGQWPNRLPLHELETRWDTDSPGIGEGMSIDASARGMFGVSKTAADLMAQEYGRSLGLRTTVLRPGCLTGSDHAGVRQHGFLAYLMRCVATGVPYLVEGSGKQVRDQLHAADVVTAIDSVWRDPPEPGEVFNLGGGRGTELSVLEALALAEQATGRQAKAEHVDARSGDHRWWVTDTAKFRSRYPGWAPARGLAGIVAEIAGRWS